MEQIIRQIQQLEVANKEEEEKIELERIKHEETRRIKETTQKEIAELEKRNQALSESILQYEVTKENVKAENEDIKSILKESKNVS